MKDGGEQISGRRIEAGDGLRVSWLLSTQYRVLSTEYSVDHGR